MYCRERHSPGLSGFSVQNQVMMFNRIPYLACAFAAALFLTSCTEDIVHEEEPVPSGSGDCELLSFSLPAAPNGLDGALSFDYDKASSTFSAMYLKWIEKDSPEMLVPEFRTDGARVLLGGNEVVSGETAVSFAEDFILTVEAENGDTKDYVISLNCPQINTELPVLRLEPEREIADKENYVDTDVTLYSPFTDAGRWSPEDGAVEVRGRGNSTWILPKKPYRLKFPEKVSPIGLDHTKAKSWVILAHDMDKSLLRNHIAFEVSRILFNPSEDRHDPSAVLFTPCSQFVNVYMNDDYHGLYQNGFWNSIFGQKGVTVTTDGSNYIALNDDVYVYTGITSVGGDQSNIGFILVNQRTKESKFYSCAGADEYSAVNSAEGVVQHLAYKATFPLLLNVSSEPTYFMALKDNAGLVKMYAMVNVQQYNIVGTGASVSECEKEYERLLAENGITQAQPKPENEIKGVVEDIRTAVISGNSYYYFRLAGQDWYYCLPVASDQTAVIVNIGDSVVITDAEESGEIRNATTIEKED